MARPGFQVHKRDLDIDTDLDINIDGDRAPSMYILLWGLNKYINVTGCSLFAAPGSDERSTCGIIATIRNACCADAALTWLFL